MNKLILSTIAALTMFTTTALADHTMYVPGNVYRDSGVITCDTKEESLRTIHAMVSTDYLTYGDTRRLAEANSCDFHRDPINFMVSELLCKAVNNHTKQTFIIAKALLEGHYKDKFTILYTKSKAPFCGEPV